MGVPGLLPLLRPATQSGVSIGSFPAQRVAVDASVWLHRGVLTFSSVRSSSPFVDTSTPIKGPLSLSIDPNVARQQVAYAVNYCMSRVELIRAAGHTPVMVFDGAKMGMKEKTNRKRKELKVRNAEKGMELLHQGRLQEAERALNSARTVSFEIVDALMKRLREKEIEIIMSLFEADAQLAYLQMTGYVDSCLTEDSDLCVFGATKVFFKLKSDGICDFLDWDRILDGNLLTEGMPKDSISFCKSLQLLSRDQFVLMCVLSGCDYTEGLSRVGLKGAIKLVSGVSELGRFIDRQSRLHKLDDESKRVIVTSFFTFKHANVFRVLRRSCSTDLRSVVPLTPVSSDSELLFAYFQLESWSFLGEMDADENVLDCLSRGYLNPLTFERFQSAPAVLCKSVVVSSCAFKATPPATRVTSSYFPKKSDSLRIPAVVTFPSLRATQSDPVPMKVCVFLVFCLIQRVNGDISGFAKYYRSASKSYECEVVDVDVDAATAVKSLNQCDHSNESIDLSPHSAKRQFQSEDIYLELESLMTPVHRQPLISEEKQHIDVEEVDEVKEMIANITPTQMLSQLYEIEDDSDPIVIEDDLEEKDDLTDHPVPALCVDLNHRYIRPNEMVMRPKASIAPTLSKAFLPKRRVDSETKKSTKKSKISTPPSSIMKFLVLQPKTV